MIEGLKLRPIQKLPDRVRLQGRVLFLAEDPALVRRQLEGEDLTTTMRPWGNSPIWA